MTVPNYQSLVDLFEKAILKPNLLPMPEEAWCDLDFAANTLGIDVSQAPANSVCHITPNGVTFETY